MLVSAGRGLRFFVVFVERAGKGLKCCRRGHLSLPLSGAPILSARPERGLKIPFLCSCTADLMVAHMRQQGYRVVVYQQQASPRGFLPAYGPATLNSSQDLAGCGT